MFFCFRRLSRWLAFLASMGYGIWDLGSRIWDLGSRIEDEFDYN